MSRLAQLSCLLILILSGTVPGQVTAIRAGHLIDPETGVASPNQIILTDQETITAVGPNVAIPAGASVIDLSSLHVLPGLVDSHDHLALTYHNGKDGGSYYLTTVLDSTAIRAIQAFSTGFQKLASGFTVVRDLGNAGNYADTALRVAIEEGWGPGPTIINSGLIIGGMGGQFWPVPEREFLVYPEYLDADTHDEIIKAVRKNVLYGAKVIKIMVDSKPYGYTVEEMQLFVQEAAKSGLKVAGHVQTPEGARRAIEAGIWSIEHSRALNDELHKMMAEKGIWRAGTETPYTPYYRGGSKERWERTTVAGLRNAYDNGVKLTFSTDADYFVPGLTRGEITIDFLITWKAAGIPAPEILKAMTVNGYAVCDIADERGPIKPGFPADIIAVSGNPLEDIDALRDVQFVMKDGRVFKRDGVVTPMDFFHSGPERGWDNRERREEQPPEEQPMLDGFTDQAKEMMTFARRTARELNQEYIGTEHLLLGLIQEETGVAISVLRDLDIDLGKLRREVEKIVQTGPTAVTKTQAQLPLSPVAERALEASIEEASLLRHDQVGTEHILLGLVEEREGLAAQVLSLMGASQETVRTAVRKRF